MDHALLIIAYVVFFIALTANFTVNFVRYMHMFQLNSYNAGEQMHWIKNNMREVLLRHIFPLAAVIYASFAVFIRPTDKTADTIIRILVCALIVAVGIFGKRKKQPVKKKLVFTPRVIRMCVAASILHIGVCALCVIFFRDGGLLLPTLCFWQIFSLFMPIIADFINKPIEKAVNSYYINDAKRIINELPNLTVIGITGSYGKTSTKFYLQKLLSSKYNVLMTPESYNTTMGVVKTVRGSLNATYDYFICEMGAKRVGEIKEICDIVKPKHSMITSIGEQHLETFKSVDNIIKTKFEIADCVSDGTVFLNYDNKYIRDHKADKNIVSYGFSSDCDYRAENISVTVKGTSFTVRAKNGEAESFSTKLIGEHNVQNILGAIAVSNTLGISLEALKIPVRRLEPVPHRMEIIDKGSHIVIDDAFNSNPSGAKAALDALKLMDGYKILITPGMVELGEREYELNKLFGAQAAQICDFVIAVGEKQAEAITDGLKGSAYSAEKYFVAKNLNEALAKANALNSNGLKKILLLENDLPDNY